MVPQGDDPASLSLILEMLRGINERLDSQNVASTQDREMLHGIALRLDRIERNQLERKVKELEEKVDTLESERDQRRGVTVAFEWVSRFGPSIVMLIAAIVAAVVYARAR